MLLLVHSISYSKFLRCIILRLSQICLKPQNVSSQNILYVRFFLQFCVNDLEVVSSIDFKLDPIPLNSNTVDLHHI